LSTNKYKLKKADLKILFATAEMLMSGGYHDVYKRLDWVQDANKNFKCINEGAHAQGVDSHASLSVNNDTGQYYCHTCGEKGNFQKYWTEYIKGSSQWGDHYSDFLIDFLSINESQTGIRFSTTFSNGEDEWNQELYELYSRCQEKYKTNKGKPFILSEQLAEEAKVVSSLPMSELDGYVDNLLKDPERLSYLFEKRRIDEDMVKNFRIGLDGRRRYVFPMIHADGDLINMKVYDPHNENRAFKWMFLHKGREILPSPMNNFTKSQIIFFGGEPDMYCGIAHGIDGAVTMGAERNTDVVKVFGHNKAKQLFTDKEIIICLDSDETGREGAKKLAKSLYPFAKQIKIIDLDKSEINPFGLDPEKVAEVTNAKGNKKMKRTEKDFTEYMEKNGFDELAIKRFLALIKNTPVYTENVERVKTELYKVTLQESRLPRYSSHDDSKVLELVASVGDFNDSAYLYPEELTIKCKHTGCPTSTLYATCKKCVLPNFSDFRENTELKFTFINGDLPKEHYNDPGCVRINTHDILSMVEVSDDKRNMCIKKLVGINPGCQFATILITQFEKLLHVRLSRDVSEYGQGILSKAMESSAIEMDAYILGDMDVYPNRSYKFKGVQTQAPNDTRAVLFIHKSEPIATSTENFVMDQDTHDILKVFRPKKGETVEQALDRRYDIFAQAAGVNGRREMFLLNDLAFFSQLEMDNKTLFPSLKRGWVEVLIGGESRCCKTMISQFLMNHYKSGDLIAGSSAVTRAGLLGGIKYNKSKPIVSWGKMVMNDGGVVIIDELSNINQDALNGITSLRSSGIADVTTVAGCKRAPARVRKIFLSNPRAWTSDKAASFGNGVRFLKHLCLKDEILSRFDIAWIVKQSDIKDDSFTPVYIPLLTEFTEFQSRYLLMWTHSRSAKEIIYEEGIEKYINSCQSKLLKKFHTNTQLINHETRLKLARMGTSVAAMMYSTPDDDWNKVYVKREHIEFVMNLLFKLYCHPNMQLDIYSEQQKDLETLGDMRFMENIIKYINPKALLLEEEFTDKSLQQLFCDYLQRVYDRELCMIDASNDNYKSTGMPVNIGTQKLINTLIIRRCLVRAKSTYRKTPAFNDWLSDMVAHKNDRELSDILEITQHESDADVIKKLEDHLQDNESPDAQQAC